MAKSPLAGPLAGVWPPPGWWAGGGQGGAWLPPNIGGGGFQLRGQWNLVVSWKKKQLLPDPSRDKPNAKKSTGENASQEVRIQFAFDVEVCAGRQAKCKSCPMRGKGIQRGKRAVGRSGRSLFGHSALGGPRRRLLPRAELHLDVHVEGGRPGGRRRGVRPLPTRCSRFPRGL